MPADDLEQRLAELEKALTEIDTARTKLVEDIPSLRLRAASRDHSLERSSVTGNSSTADKLALSRRLFASRPAGRLRATVGNPKAGKSVYSPAIVTQSFRRATSRPIGAFFLRPQAIGTRFCRPHFAISREIAS